MTERDGHKLPPRGPDKPPRAGLDGTAGLTLRRLRIFSAVARSHTLTGASKQLGLAQPTLSQQISNLEEVVGAPLFDRRSNRLTLTEAGTHLLRHVEPVLSTMQRLEEGLWQLAEGKRQTIHLAGINSVLRVILPKSMHLIHDAYPNIDYDIHESGPAEVLEMLYGRRVNLGLLSANSIAPASAGFLHVPLFDDPYVLAVPERLNLDGVTHPAVDLRREDRNILMRSIQFVFGTPHAHRVQAWYDEAIPGNWPFTQARSFEVALGMVRSGLGVCLAPALSSVVGDKPIPGLRLYRVNFPPRQIVALLPSQYARQEPYAALLEALQEVGRLHAPPTVNETPPFLRDKEAVLAT
ncbi:LysR family transcriptional regulator [Roseitranquillus sediminis]|uniref:LysR family transcriptional regulator n=1 Tax=Roseitranquillus sediminis TaxID=2809051 RepID=UPI001D0C5D9C|nr:LysR family transcriptional regulator [Roseitranquillus sediminis]MBM9595944.1 LysR family transcriptional regulator [Roseitranquillus sediminis]